MQRASRLSPRDEELTKRIATVDEKPGLCRGRQGEALEHALTNLGMSPVEGANANGEHDVVWLFVILQDEIFARDLADAHAAGRDFVCRGGFGLGDRRGGSVDGQDVAGGEPGCDRSCGRPGPAPNFEDTRVRLKGKRVHDRGEAG